MSDLLSLLKTQECAICLSSTSTSPCLLDSCSHLFCLSCISEWAKIGGRICPLCKRTFCSIIFNIRSDTQFRTRRLDRPDSQGSPLDVADSDCAFRRSLYDRGLAGHTAISSNLVLPDHKDAFRAKDHLNRLRPWLVRELQALTEDWNPQLLVSMVEGLLTRVGLEKATLQSALQEFLFSRASVFVVELTKFVYLNRPMNQFDALARYDVQSSPPVPPSESSFSYTSSVSSAPLSELSLSSSVSPLESPPDPEPTALREWKIWAARAATATAEVDDDVECLGQRNSARTKRVVIDLVVDVSSSEEDDLAPLHGSDPGSSKRSRRVPVINLVGLDSSVPPSSEHTNTSKHSKKQGNLRVSDVVEVFSEDDVVIESDNEGFSNEFEDQLMSR